MRALAVALLLSVPLSASDRSLPEKAALSPSTSDKSSLEKAVELFRSPDAGRRETASQLADRELRRVLAPLLKAMEDDDPEVRGRARRSILSLVPVEKPEVWDSDTAGDLIRKSNQLLADFGARGAITAKGYQVMRVRRHSPAARLGLRFGDVVVLLNGHALARRGQRARLATLSFCRDALAALGDKPDWSRITVTVLRKGQYVRLPKK